MRAMGSRTYLLLASALVLAGCPDDPVSEGLDDDGGTSTGDPTTGSPTSSPTTDPGTTSSSTTSADSSSGETTVDPDTGSSSTSEGSSSSSSGGSSSSSTGSAAGPEIEVTVDDVAAETGDIFTAADTTAVGANGDAVTIEVTNAGDETLDLFGLELAGAVPHFSLDIAGFDDSLEPGESTSFIVNFAPTNGGLKQSTVILSSTDADESPFYVNLRASTTPNLWRNISTKGGPSARYNMALAELEPGLLLTFGGRGTGGAVLGDTWLYDVEAGEWMEASPLDSPTARFSYGMDSAGEGIAVLTGGTLVPGEGGSAQNDTWHFDSLDFNWVPSMNLGEPPFRHQAAVAGFDGGLFSYGGIDDTPDVAGILSLYEVATQTWITVDINDPGTRLAAAAAFDDGVITLSGGFDFGKINVLDSAYDIDLDGDTIDPHVAPAIGPIYSHELVYLRPGFAVAFGGRGVGQIPRGDTFSYEPGTGTWADLDPAVAPSPRFNFGMTAVGENKLIMFGGSTAGKGPVPTVEVWEYVGPLP